MFKKTSAVHKKGKIKRRVIDPSKIMLLKQLALGLLLFTILGFLVSILWYTTRVSFLTITEVTIAGGETIPHDVVEKIVRNTLTGTYVGIIPRQFAWWYPQSEIIANISQIPRMKNPLVERESGHVLTVRFEEYQPYALWCADRTSADCVFIDATGYAFGAAPKLSGGAFLRYRTLGRDMKVGSAMAEPSELETMETFVSLVETNLPFAITHIETDTAGDVYYIVSGGGEFKASLKDDAQNVFDNLRTIVGSKEFNDLRPGNFQYIDLRFGNKVFVNEEVGGVGSTTATTTTQSVAEDIHKKQLVPPATPSLLPRPAEEELPT